ncbi:MAG: hypothetical protein ACTSR7_00675, partial [Promethearchaeota archaeon]
RWNYGIRRTRDVRRCNWLDKIYGKVGSIKKLNLIVKGYLLTPLFFFLTSQQKINNSFKLSISKFVS